MRPPRLVRLATRSAIRSHTSSIAFNAKGKDKPSETTRFQINLTMMPADKSTPATAIATEVINVGRESRNA